MRPGPPRTAPLAVPLAVALLAVAATATVVQRLDLAGLAQRAEIIVEGRVLRASTELDRRGHVATRVVLSVDRRFKGPVEGGPTFEFAVPGGELGDRGLFIAGMPGFTAGEEVVLFLTEETHRGIRVPTGLGQGKLVVVRDPVSGARTLRRDLAGLRLVEPATGRPAAARPGAVLDYDGFVQQLEEIVARQEDER